MPSATPQALAGVKVIDLSGPMGNYCGKLLADLGAEVILVEPPGGTALRHRPPFVADPRGGQVSSAFLYFNTGKRSLTVDFDDADDLRLLRAVMSHADLVIETESPGTHHALTLGW
jgi:benzylsuccinate CoA-transferase BbsE subunit